MCFLNLIRSATVCLFESIFYCYYVSSEKLKTTLYKKLYVIMRVKFAVHEPLGMFLGPYLRGAYVFFSDQGFRGLASPPAAFMCLQPCQPPVYYR